MPVQVLTENNDPRKLAWLDFWFFASFVKTKDENSGEVRPFPEPEEMPFLDRLHKAIEENRKTIVHKARQMMVSWYVVIRFLWKANCCQDGRVWSGAIVSKKEEDAAKLLDRLWFAYERLPRWLKKPAQRYKGQKGMTIRVTFGENVEIQALAATEDIGRSRTYSEVLLDELAFLPYDDEMMESLDPTIADGATKLIGVSTGNGKANLFARIVEQPQPDNYTSIVKIGWQEHPLRDNAWKQRRLEELAALHASWEKAIEVFAREYDLSLEGREGIIYDTFNEVTHVCEDFDIPSAWEHGVYIDPHPSKPTAILLVAISPGDVLYLCDSIWRAESSDRLVAEMRAKWAQKRILDWLIDPHSDNENNLVGKDESVNIFKLFQKQIPALQKAPGSPEARIDAVRQRLAIRPLTGQPGLKVFRSQKRVIWEFKHYSTEKNANDEPVIVKRDDDFMDCTGYACVRPPKSLGWNDSQAEGEFQTPKMASMRR